MGILWSDWRLGESGNVSFFVFGRSQNFDFLGFFGRPPTQPSFNFWLKIQFLTILKIFISSHPPNHVRTGLVGRFLAILKISDFCQKFEFWVFWGIIGHSGTLEMSVFLVFSRFQNFYFFWFFLSV